MCAVWVWGRGGLGAALQAWVGGAHTRHGAPNIAADIALGRGARLRCAWAFHSLSPRQLAGAKRATPVRRCRTPVNDAPARRGRGPACGGDASHHGERVGAAARRGILDGRGGRAVRQGRARDRAAAAGAAAAGACAALRAVAARRASRGTRPTQPLGRIPGPTPATSLGAARRTQVAELVLAVCDVRELCALSLTSKFWRAAAAAGMPELTLSHVVLLCTRASSQSRQRLATPTHARTRTVRRRRVPSLAAATIPSPGVRPYSRARARRRAAASCDALWRRHCASLWADKARLAAARLAPAPSYLAATMRPALTSATPDVASRLCRRRPQALVPARFRELSSSGRSQEAREAARRTEPGSPAMR